MKRLLSLVILLVLFTTAINGSFAEGGPGELQESYSFAGMTFNMYVDPDNKMYVGPNGEEDIRGIFTYEYDERIMLVAEDVLLSTLQRYEKSLIYWYTAAGNFMFISSEEPRNTQDVGLIKDFAIGKDCDKRDSPILVYVREDGTIGQYPEVELKKVPTAHKNVEAVYYNPSDDIDYQCFFWIVPQKKGLYNIFGAYPEIVDKPFWVGKNVRILRIPMDKDYGLSSIFWTSSKEKDLYGLVQGIPKLIVKKSLEGVVQQNENYALFKARGLFYVVTNHLYNEQVVQLIPSENIPEGMSLENFNLLEDSITWEYDGREVTWDCMANTKEGIDALQGNLGEFWVQKDSGQCTEMTLPGQP